MPGKLAEGQKSEAVQHIYLAPPPLRQPIELAEWVEFPEKNGRFWVLEAAIWRRGPQLDYDPIDGDFERADLAKNQLI